MEQRKSIRLADYDYSQNGAYFITICTKNKQCLFWKKGHHPTVEFVGADIIRPDVPLSDMGEIVNETINQIPTIYPAVFVDNYIIMPNHVHLLLKIDGFGGRMISAPTISTVVGQMKRAASKKAGIPLWQKSFYDHVVRSQQDYYDIWQYISNNPLTWDKDTLFVNQ